VLLIAPTCRALILEVPHVGLTVRPVLPILLFIKVSNRPLLALLSVLPELPVDAPERTVLIIMNVLCFLRLIEHLVIFLRKFPLHDATYLLNKELVTSFHK